MAGISPPQSPRSIIREWIAPHETIEDLYGYDGFDQAVITITNIVFHPGTSTEVKNQALQELCKEMESQQESGTHPNTLELLEELVLKSSSENIDVNICMRLLKEQLFYQGQNGISSVMINFLILDLIRNHSAEESSRVEALCVLAAAAQWAGDPNDLLKTTTEMLCDPILSNKGLKTVIFAVERAIDFQNQTFICGIETEKIINKLRSFESAQDEVEACIPGVLEIGIRALSWYEPAVSQAIEIISKGRLPVDMWEHVISLFQKIFEMSDDNFSDTYTPLKTMLRIIEQDLDDRIHGNLSSHDDTGCDSSTLDQVKNAELIFRSEQESAVSNIVLRLTELEMDDSELKNLSSMFPKGDFEFFDMICTKLENLSECEDRRGKALYILKMISQENVLSSLKRDLCDRDLSLIRRETAAYALGYMAKQNANQKAHKADHTLQDIAYKADDLFAKGTAACAWISNKMEDHIPLGMLKVVVEMASNPEVDAKNTASETLQKICRLGGDIAAEVGQLLLTAAQNKGASSSSKRKAPILVLGSDSDDD